VIPCVLELLHETKDTTSADRRNWARRTLPSAPEREGSEQYNDFPKYIDYIFGKINANEPVGFYIDLDDYVTRMYFNSRMVASIGIVNLMEFV